MKLPLYLELYDSEENIYTLRDQNHKIIVSQISKADALEISILVNKFSEMKSVLDSIKADMLSEIDGGEECRGRDQWLTEQINKIDSI